MLLSKQKIDYHREYFKNSYQQPLRSNQGLDEILQAIKKYSRQGKWLDLGCGSNSFLWRIPMGKDIELTCVDIDLEAEIVLKEIKDERFKDGCYLYAFENYSNLTYDQVYSTPYKFIKQDLFQQKITFDETYDMISQFGLLGLSYNIENFIEKSEEILQSLKSNGIYIGVNWIFSEELSNKKKFNNSFIDESLIQEVADKNGCAVLKIQKVHIEGDQNYDELILYVLQKNANSDVGYQQIFDCYGINVEKIGKEVQIKEIIHGINNLLNHKILEEAYHSFSPQGITGFAIISGSHIAIHTWPEYGYISIDVFSCYYKKDSRDILNFLTELLETTDIKIREIKRNIS